MRQSGSQPEVAYSLSSLTLSSQAHITLPHRPSMPVEGGLDDQHRKETNIKFEPSPLMASP